MRGATGLLLLALAVPVLLASGCGEGPAQGAPGSTASGSAPHVAGPATARPAYVGTQVCAGCHPQEAGRWRGSHHDLAMQEADARSVRGAFDGATASHSGVSARFVHRDGRFVVETQDAEGALREFPVAYTLGVEPLQQFLVRFPDGRLQALDFAWDARPVEAGGQRWFHLHPEEEVGSGDVLHWTGPAYRWNTLCAECHSTGVRRDYDPEADRWTARWAEVDVGCEACHGPGSVHVRRAGEGTLADHSGLTVDLSREGSWRFEGDARIARRVPPAPDRRELDTCAPCHARRDTLDPSWLPGDSFLDGYRPALLEEALYHADGQIRDEVFVWGSFVQSRMHAAGVTCSDCHDPHALAIEEPDATCAGCHRPEAFATPTHHRHPEGSPGASCVACHMPARTYMVVDDRRDHGFRLPRPDLAAELGVPDPCTRCHADREPAWAAEAAARWWKAGRRNRPHWTEAVHAGRTRTAGAAVLLRSVFGERSLPAIVRATAVSLLAELPDAEVGSLLARAAEDAEPLVRVAAAEAGARLDPAGRARVLGPRLRDPVRAVRVAAGRALATAPDALLAAGERPARDAAVEAWFAAQRVAAGSAAAHVNLGVLHAERGELRAADAQYAIALRVNPHFVPAWVNRADLMRARGEEARAQELLRRALALDPDAAEVHHALGLSLVRAGRMAEALDALKAAATRAPDQPRFAYVYAVALHGAGRVDRALGVLEASHSLHPTDRDILVALATLHRDAGRPAQALRWARELAATAPEDPRAGPLVRSLEGAVGGG